MLSVNEIIETIENDLEKVDKIIIDVSNLSASDFEYLLNYLKSLDVDIEIERYENKVYLIVSKIFENII